ncbi:MAG: HAD-IA family hydrolase [Candidatus Competibacteraceae bacterium]|nr:HAD-IA family hydrolase [Candidatus Competibacteraceae bacterium]
MSVIAGRAFEPPACVLFDLDGTLVDTAPDLTAALNLLRAERALPPLPVAAIRLTVSQGSPGMLKAGFGLLPDAPDYPELNQRFLQGYRAAIAVESGLFPGMAEVLEQLERRSIPWGVVTNKPGWLTEPLLKGLGLWSRSACVVSGDTLAKAKPHPEPLLYACDRLAASPRQSLYVGDAERDIVAGQRAGMRTLVAGFGYLSPEDRPQEWGADGMLDQPGDLLAWLDQPGSTPVIAP